MTCRQLVQVPLLENVDDVNKNAPAPRTNVDHASPRNPQPQASGAYSHTNSEVESMTRHQQKKHVSLVEKWLATIFVGGAPFLYNPDTIFSNSVVVS